MGLEAIHPGSAANPAAMRGLRVCAGILPPQARARHALPTPRKHGWCTPTVHIPEQERLSRGTGLWSRTLPSPRHGRRGQFVTYPHCEINCGGGDRRMSRSVGARGGSRRASASPACGDPTPGNGPPRRSLPARPGHAPATATAPSQDGPAAHVVASADAPPSALRSRRASRAHAG